MTEVKINPIERHVTIREMILTEVSEVTSIFNLPEVKVMQRIGPEMDVDVTVVAGPGETYMTRRCGSATVKPGSAFVSLAHSGMDLGPFYRRVEEELRKGREH